MPILNPIETLMEIRDLCENSEELSSYNIDLELAKEHDRLITIIQDLCEDALRDIAINLEPIIK
jgi:hypothetical protein